MRTPTRALTAILVTAAAALGQSTWIVGTSSGLPQIVDAIQIASPGDEIVVGPGTYAHFVDDKGVTIRASFPGSVTIELDPNYFPTACDLVCMLFERTRLEPPPGQQSHVVGLRFDNNIATVAGIPLRHRVFASGRVTIDSCEVWADGIAALDCSGEVFIQDTAVHVSGQGALTAAMRLFSGSVTAVDSDFFGGSIAAPGTPGVAIELWGTSILHASGVRAQGGNQWGSDQGAPGIACMANGQAWLSDSLLLAGNGPCALSVSGGNVHTARTAITENGGTCASPTDQPGLLGLARTAPLSLGTSFELSFRTTPGTLIGVLAATELARSDLPGLAQQPIWLAPGLAQAAGILLSDATGQATISWQIPYIPGLVGAQLWFQGVAGAALPLTTSPIAGGVAR